MLHISIGYGQQPYRDYGKKRKRKTNENNVEGSVGRWPRNISGETHAMVHCGALVTAVFYHSCFYPLNEKCFHDNPKIIGQYEGIMFNFLTGNYKEIMMPFSLK